MQSIVACPECARKGTGNEFNSDCTKFGALFNANFHETIFIPSIFRRGGMEERKNSLWIRQGTYSLACMQPPCTFLPTV